MPQAIIILYDNSDYMRNGDYSPSRKIGEIEAVNEICEACCTRDPETTMGLVSMAGLPSVAQSLVKDNGHINSAVCKLPLSGSINLLASIHIAKLALSHREPKHARQRIIAFVGSPVVSKGFSSDEEKQKFNEKLASEGVKLRREGIQLDIVSFGEIEANRPFLSILNRESTGGDPELGTFLEAIPNSDNISSKVICSSIINPDFAAPVGTGGVPPSSAGTDLGYGDLGFDPNTDPELAAAILASLEDQKQQNGGSGPSAMGMSDEEALQRALMMSLETSQPSSSEKKEQQSSSSAGDADDETAMKMAMELSKASETSQGSKSNESDMNDDGDEEMDEDEALRLAIEMSIQEEQKRKKEEEEEEEKKKKQQKSDSDMKDEEDEEEMDDEEALKLALELSLQQEEKEEEEEKKKKEKKDDEKKD